MKCPAATIVALVLTAGPLHAQSLAVSLGIRETQAGGGASGGPIFSDGGSAGGIEIVNLDGQMLTVDGNWQFFTFTPETDSLTAFAGTTASNTLDGDWGTLEHIRIRNVDGITAPLRVWIDDITNSCCDAPGALEGFEGFAQGSEVMFQEPRFSGSTFANLLPAPDVAEVTDAEALNGSQSYVVSFQFVDAVTTRWVRLITFNTPTLPNPAVILRGDSEGAARIGFWLRAEVAEEVPAMPLPLTILLVLGLLAFAASRLRGPVHRAAR